MKWFLTGVSGYIGRHLAIGFNHAGFEVIGIDRKSLIGPRELTNNVKFYLGDIRDEKVVQSIIFKEKPDGIVNLAALKSVSGSYQNSQEYGEVNHMGAKNLLDLAISGNVSSFIQASTAAVYAPQLNGVGHEFSDTQPVSPYGKTKLAAEDLVTAATQANLISGLSLRYFNVLGSSEPSLRDESRDNIVPMVLDKLVNNLEPLIFGDDYPTVDGTCVRDYIHVLELVNAHVLAAKKLNIESLPTVLNVGTGKGTTVLQVINEILLQKKSRLHPKILERRLGDQSTLIASTELAEKTLGFKAEIGLEKMIESAI